MNIENYRELEFEYENEFIINVHSDSIYTFIIRIVNKQSLKYSGADKTERLPKRIRKWVVNISYIMLQKSTVGSVENHKRVYVN